MSDTLLLISADTESDRALTERGEAPRRDYDALRRLLQADVLDFGSVRKNRIGSPLVRVAGRGATHALLARQRLGEYKAIFSDGEHIGFFVAVLLAARRSRPRHVVLAHHLSPLKKRPIARLARRGIDLLIVHAEAQRRFAVARLGFAPEQVRTLPYQVDPDFWQPAGGAEEVLVSSAGLELRDYEALIRATEDPPVNVSIGAASNWSGKRNLLDGRRLPERVEVRSYEYRELRDLYARSSLVAVPLFETDFQAGITLILEAMAMAKPVVVTRTEGQQGTVVGPLWTADQPDAWPAGGPSLERSTGIYVPPEDVGALRGAICFLLEHREAGSALGANARRAVEERYTVDHFAHRFAAAIAPWKFG